ncbi:type I-E CRISPR-associated protein Cse1/CasA [Streptomyces sp. NBC_01237]|uniref:type I-E CRISPR-associated protein Cse1/CasA n=1 Tax=Streptomyces sp. NBC_01237 TaxID=2903790 RepID=UPI002DD81982|nr:type I-E CRISPR-associated protein Cse1/CasA [Streptomyces sp. NBC_01237]WRZ77203.1 type I-E CRISPR-associated protein Cse1/CasA [Streptomyces sp. NBC_01237]
MTATAATAAFRPSVSLAELPFIEVAYPCGKLALLSLAQVLEQGDRVRLVTTDPLLWAATVRLLLAVAYAAGSAPSGKQQYRHQVLHGLDLEPAARWVRAHAGDLDLFDPHKPLFQDGSLHAVAEGRPDAAIPVLYLDVTAAVRRPLLSDHRHLHASVPVSAARAAGLILVQQMWCLSGRITGNESVYGKGSTFGSRSAACGGLVIQPDGTVSQVLSWRLIPVLGRGPGTAHWTYTSRPARGQRQAPASESGALTWHHRRILLLAQDEGTVARVLFAQGRRPGKQTAPLTDRPGCRDLLTTESGAPLPARAVTGEEDTAPLLHSWWTAPAGSWAHTARRAAEALGCQPPDVRVTGLTVSLKKIDNVRHVFLPGSLLGDFRGKGAAAHVMNTRAQAAEARPGFGSTHLHQETFMRSSDTERTTALLDDLAAGDLGLFVTADTPRRPAETDDPVDVLTRKLGTWARSHRTRALMADLAAWAAEPNPTNPAYASVTRLVPEELHEAAMLTAALFAAHRRAASSAPVYGNAPIARLMRAGGTGRRRGPGHRATRASVTLVLDAQCLEDLRAPLLHLVRDAARGGMTPDWTWLLHDLSHWGPAVRQAWRAQFYTASPLPPRREQPASADEGHLAA